jgi:hypothetical protein
MWEYRFVSIAAQAPLGNNFLEAVDEPSKSESVDANEADLELK